MSEQMNIFQKLIEVRKTVPYLKKENVGYQYNFVSSSQVLGNLKQKMDELNVLLIPRVVGKKVTTDIYDKIDGKGNIKRTVDYLTELDMTFTWVNADNPSETIDCPWYGQGIDTSGEKGVGKALTYAEKYFMLKFFNIPTDKDDPDTFQRKTGNDTDAGKQETGKNQQQGGQQSSQTKTDNNPVALGKKRGLSEIDVKLLVWSMFKKQEIKDLTKEQLNKICSNLINFTDENLMPVVERLRQAKASADAKKADTEKLVDEVDKGIKSQEMSTTKQQQKIHITAGEKGMKQDNIFRGWLNERYKTESTKALTKKQASECIEYLDKTPQETLDGEIAWLKVRGDGSAA